jgi:hypothetical protein
LISSLAAVVLWLVVASLDTFMTLCKAYIRIEPHFNLWSYYFRARLR